MHPEDRRKLNQKIKAFQYRLGIDDDTFRQIVLNTEPRSEGHLTHCDDESANLILISLRRAAERLPISQSPSRRVPSSHQHRQIARLMDYLDWSWKQTAGLCQRMTGKPRTDKCTPHELSIITRGMVAIIDGDLKSGKLRLSDKDLQDYLEHTKKLRKVEEHAALCATLSALCDKPSGG